MSQTLNDKLSAAEELGLLHKKIPDDIARNLAPNIILRPYQLKALERFIYFFEDFPDKPSNLHLLFHMATGSGKTVLMAALILDLYNRGYRNFLFFVNATQIIEKTKANFLDSTSAKYLFASQIRIADRLVDIQLVENFEGVNDEAINIHFTTIQGLHLGMQNPKENAVTMEDFQHYKVVMLSDEAHHLSTETKRKLNSTEVSEKKSWEATATEIFNQHPENILLEFTATVDMGHEDIHKKYQDKLLYDYPLRRFRWDGYSKDIELRQADLPPQARMMQAMILSQYRRKVAEAHGIHCKPVILMKSKTIKDSFMNENVFSEMVSSLNEASLLTFKSISANDRTLSRAFSYILDERGMETGDFVRELKVDFGPDKVVNVNKLEDLEMQQIELNTLESLSNELRVIFAVNKLNEGWDVLNLFDIVRLYDTRDGKGNKVGSTTMAEAQLLGRGARYFPFVDPNQQDAFREKRKFDNDTTNTLRILEELHYHCSHNPQYISDIRKALHETGMLAAKEHSVTLRLKDSFKQSPLYKEGYIWTNSRIKNDRKEISRLDAYTKDIKFTSSVMTARTAEISAFGADQKNLEKSEKIDVASKDLNLSEFDNSIVGFAMDANSFFHFDKLRIYFPHLTSTSEFQKNEAYLGGVTVTVNGLRQSIENLTSKQKLEITNDVLHQIEISIKRKSTEYLGTNVLSPHKISDRFTDITMKLRAESETARGLNTGESDVEGVTDIRLAYEDWHAYDNFFGTDQENYLVRFIQDQSARLRSLYDDLFLLRNEKAVKLFAVENGQGFEPDFVLFLLEKRDKESIVLQLFIEPKGDHLMEHDRWKEILLNNINFRMIFEGYDYIVYGLPFFNEQGESNKVFKQEFADKLTRELNF